MNKKFDYQVLGFLINAIESCDQLEVVFLIDTNDKPSHLSSHNPDIFFELAYQKAYKYVV